jgi:transcriptional regulator with XRE-family HTH domain
MSAKATQSTQLDTLGARLRGERKRLGLRQDEFAQSGGVSRNAQLNYEKGSRSPDANYLAGVARVGVDVQYVITGKRARTGAVRPELDAKLLLRSMQLVNGATFKKGVVFGTGLFSHATAVVYNRLSAAEEIKTEAAEREAANVVDVLANADAAVRHDLRTGSKLIDELLRENIRLRVLHVKRFLEQTLDSPYGKFIEADLGDPRGWPGLERVKLLLDLDAEQLITFGQGVNKIKVINEGRCAAWLSREIDAIKKHLADADGKRAA